LGGEPGALTVAGQWRTFTAFPSILTIAVVNAAEKQAGVVGLYQGMASAVPQNEPSIQGFSPCGMRSFPIHPILLFRSMHHPIRSQLSHEAAMK
jgi:hypothetical protein